MKIKKKIPKVVSVVPLIKITRSPKKTMIKDYDFVNSTHTNCCN